jgi:hypothetical protein
MLQMRRFQTLNAAGAKTIQIAVRCTHLLEQLCQTPNFVVALKNGLENDELMTRVASIFVEIGRCASTSCLAVLKQEKIIKALFSSLRNNFRSKTSQVSAVVSYQVSHTFNISLACKIVQAATNLLQPRGGNQVTIQQQQQQLSPMVLEFTREEMTALDDVFKTIVTEMQGQNTVFGSQISRNLFQFCVAFLTQLSQQYQVSCCVVFVVFRILL